MIGTRHGCGKTEIFPFKFTAQHLLRMLMMDGKQPLFQKWCDR